MERCEGCGKPMVRCPFCDGAMHVSDKAMDSSVGVCAYCAGYICMRRNGADVRVRLLLRSEFDDLPADTREAMQADRSRVIAGWDVNVKQQTH